MLQTYFRHFSLYEYSFKPKIDMLIHTNPKDHEYETDLKAKSDLDRSIMN